MVAEQLGKILTGATNKVPIIMVLNKCDANQDFVAEVERQVKEDCIWAASVVRVAADPKHGPLNQLCEKCGSPDISISTYRRRYACNECRHDDSFKKSYGLDELVKVTVGHLPGVVATSFSAAQKVWLEGLDQVAIRDICGFALTAGGIGAAPIPALTRLVLYPVQYAMVIRLATIYGVILSSSAGLHLVGSLSFISLAGLSGWGLATLLKCIPGLSVAGMATDAAVSSSVTLVMGLVTKTLLRRVRGRAMCNSDELAVTPEDLAEIMSNEERTSLFSEYFGRLTPTLAALFAEGAPSCEALEGAAAAAEGIDLTRRP
ncbi:unnamed protein product [Prorocentrum cordatum]|uniref:Uncharacterized protein n=1 Tax=Prorocentrum cordatum TaxID=2364126 RepID=A0ABN9XXN4_9DINO|nr:unnamed protein product [Polarella glacialis]